MFIPPNSTAIKTLLTEDPSQLNAQDVKSAFSMGFFGCENWKIQPKSLKKPPQPKPLDPNKSIGIGAIFKDVYNRWVKQQLLRLKDNSQSYNHFEVEEITTNEVEEAENKIEEFANAAKVFHQKKQNTNQSANQRNGASSIQIHQPNQKATNPNAIKLDHPRVKQAIDSLFGEHPEDFNTQAYKQIQIGCLDSLENKNPTLILKITSHSGQNEIYYFSKRHQTWFCIYELINDGKKMRWQPIRHPSLSKIEENGSNIADADNGMSDLSIKDTNVSNLNAKKHINKIKNWTVIDIETAKKDAIDARNQAFAEDLVKQFALEQLNSNRHPNNYYSPKDITITPTQTYKFNDYAGETEKIEATKYEYNTTSNATQVNKNWVIILKTPQKFTRCYNVGL